MTKDEFVTGYAARSNVTIEKLLEHREPFPCDCGEDGCEGWKMLSRDYARESGVCVNCGREGWQHKPDDPEYDPY